MYLMEMVITQFEQMMVYLTMERGVPIIMGHILLVIQQGAKKIIIQTVDMFVLVILIGQFFYLQQLHSLIDIWIAFGKNYCFYSIYHNVLDLGGRTSNALPMFHVFTGYDTTSSFYRKGKKLHGNHGRAAHK